MTNRIALFLAPLLALLIWADLHFAWGGTLFLSRRLNDLIEWLAFWR